MGVTFHEDTKFKDELEEEENAKLKEPTFVDKLKQQRLEGKYFLTTKSHAISTTVFFGLLFIGISLLLKSANQQVILKKIRYDNETKGYVDFEIRIYMPLPVYFYYELRNTFLVHRSLNSAFCNPQIFGRLGTYPPENACDKWKLSKYSCENPTKLSPFSLQPYCAKGQKYYAPTGGAAAIMFNDSFLLSKNGKSLFWKEEGVISKRLQQQVLEPYEKTDNLCDTDMYRNTVKPIGWKRHICEMGGYRNITLLKWLESTTNKNFKKFYRILDEKKHPRGLMPGVYRLYVDNVYWPTNSQNAEYRMEKFFWILHPSWIGTEQRFLEVMYLLVGIGLLILSSCLVGLQIFLMNRRKNFDKDKDYDFYKF